MSAASVGYFQNKTVLGRSSNVIDDTIQPLVSLTPITTEAFTITDNGLYLVGVSVNIQANDNTTIMESLNINVVDALSGINLVSDATYNTPLIQGNAFVNFNTYFVSVEAGSEIVVYILPTFSGSTVAPQLNQYVLNLVKIV
jgi:hypothetical protein